VASGRRQLRVFTSSSATRRSACYAFVVWPLYEAIPSTPVDTPRKSGTARFQWINGNIFQTAGVVLLVRRRALLVPGLALGVSLGAVARFDDRAVHHDARVRGSANRGAMDRGALRRRDGAKGKHQTSQQRTPDRKV
jgi:hypothetical protein